MTLFFFLFFMNNKSNSILVSFDMIFDVDYGLIQLIRNENYNKLDTFKSGIYNLNDLYLHQLLSEREEENPLSIIIYNKYKNQMNSFYNQFITNKYENILKYTIPTDLYNLINVYKKTNLVSIDILCRNKLQEQFIDNHCKFSRIMVEDLSKLDLSKYDTLYIKYFKNALSIKNKLIGKNLYIANYKWNLNKDDNILPKSEIRDVLSDALSISVIDIYNKEKFKDIKG